MRGLWILLVLISCNLSNTTNENGSVVAISDGDTFTLLGPGNRQVKVRLYGIDCPEKAQPFGTAARQKLSDLVFSQPVRLDTRDVDRYGRTIAVVYNQKGLNVNEEMLRTGFAWHYKQYDKNPEWDKLERQAQRKRLGLWSQPNPTPPWRWRKEKRAPAL
jgi:endonuclease YncB( thermonuclease family)